MVQDYDGTAVVDAAGEKIGTVERSYVDDTGAVRVVSIKMGRLRAKHRLVPVDDVRPEEDALRIPYTKQVVEDSPDVGVDDALEGETLEKVRAYYGSGRERLAHDRATVQEREAAVQEREAAVQEREAAVQERQATVREVGEAEAREVAAVPAAAEPEMGQVGDRDEVIEVPIVEEELVKRPVVKEILRIRKHTVTDRQQVDEALRKEDIEIDRQGDADVRVDDQRRS